MDHASFFFEATLIEIGVYSSFLLDQSWLVPRPHYYARPMRFGSRGRETFGALDKLGEVRHFVSLGAKLLEAGELSITFPPSDERSPAAVESTEDKYRAFLFYARFHC